MASAADRRLTLGRGSHRCLPPRQVDGFRGRPSSANTIQDAGPVRFIPAARTSTVSVSLGSDPTELAIHPPASVAVVVGLGHLTHRMHIFQESHVPSQQT